MHSSLLKSTQRFHLTLVCIQNRDVRTSLEIQWLKLSVPVQGVQVRSLVRELRPMWGVAQKKKTHSCDTTLMVEDEEKLKSLLIRVKEGREKAGLKLNIKNTKIVASGPITPWQIDG